MTAKKMWKTGRTEPQREAPYYRSNVRDHEEREKARETTGDDDLLIDRAKAKSRN